MAFDTRRAIDAVWRIESAKIICGLARVLRDVGLAEKLAPDALVTVLEPWPESSVPEPTIAQRIVRAKGTLADLFDGRSQLIIYHFMFGP